MKAFYDHRGGVVEVADDVTTCYDTAGPWTSHRLFGADQAGATPTFQAMTLCGKRAGDMPGRATIDCHECADAMRPPDPFAPPNLPDTWQVKGPRFKDAGSYLSKDGDNPEAPTPGYGWPLGTECWYFVVTRPGYGRLVATGRTAESAARRAEVIVAARENR